MSPMAVRGRDVTTAMRLIAEGREDDCDPGAPLPWSVLDGLRSLVGCETLSFCLVDSVTRTSPVQQDLPDEGYTDTDATLATFYDHYWACTACSYPDRSGDLDLVYRASDFYSARQFRATAMWAEYLQPYGVAHELVACVGGIPGRTLRLLMFRGPGRDFTDRDRALLWLLRPHLHRLYRDRRAPDRVPLTARQRELLALVAAGLTNRQIGRRLGITEATVRKHLEHIFGRLGVASRTEAVSRAFPG